MNTPFKKHFAGKAGHPNIVDTLIAAKADVNVPTTLPQLIVKRRVHVFAPTRSFTAALEIVWAVLLMATSSGRLIVAN